MSFLSVMGRWLRQAIVWFRPDAAAEPALPLLHTRIKPELEWEPKPDQGPPPEREVKSEAQARDFSLHHLRRDLADEAWRILERFEVLNVRKADYAREDLLVLQDLWGCDFLLLDYHLGKRMKGGDKWSVVDGVPAQETIEAIWPFDYAFAISRDQQIELWRIKSVEPKEVRGIVQIVRPRMIHLIVGAFGDNGMWSCGDNYFGLFDETWQTLTPKGDYRFENFDSYWTHRYSEEINFMLPSILAARYEWHVAFGTIAGGPRILFPTNPGGALKLFKNRELELGQTRRSALKHWVQEHWRDSDEAGLQYVCSHLRGHTQFKWSELDCELFVSTYDLEKNEFFKQQASEWRAQRKHNRVRVRIKRGHHGHKDQWAKTKETGSDSTGSAKRFGTTKSCD